MTNRRFGMLLGAFPTPSLPIGALLLVALLIVAAIGCELGGPVPNYEAAADDANRTPQWSADGQSIVVNLGYRIYRVSTDGRQLTRLPEQADAGQFSPSLSPEGRIAFLDATSIFAYKMDIATMNSEGKRIKRHWRTTSSEGAGVPQWSPNGQQIAFTTERHDNARDAYVSESIIIDKHGSEVARHTSFFGTGGMPSWSNNGEQIAFTWCRRPQPCAMTIMGLDGAARTVLDVVGFSPPGKPQVHPVANLSSAAWSTDDQKIYYIQVQGFHRPAELYPMNIDTMESQFIADLGGYWIRYIQLSPDGSTLLYTARKTENDFWTNDEVIYMVNTDGTDRRDITPFSMESLPDDPSVHASWSPDGSRIAVVAGNNSLYTIASDGTDLRVLIYRDERGNFIPGGGRLVQR